MPTLPHPKDLFADQEARVARELRAAQLVQLARLHRESLTPPAPGIDLRRRLGGALVAIGTWLAPEQCLEPCQETC